MATAKKTTTPSEFWQKKTLEQRAAEQGVGPVQHFEDLLGDFWPEDETADAFINAVRQWRRQENPE